MFLSSLVFFPLAAAMYLWFFNQTNRAYLVSFLMMSYLTVMCIATYALWWFSITNTSGDYIYVYRFFSWNNMAGSDVGLSLWFDYVSVIMCFTVLLVAGMVNIFSIYYMGNDPFVIRFFVYLSLFTFCMLLLVTAADLVQFFIGWELVGLCSYLLINFWYTRKQANKAALKAILVNRVGDFALMYAIALIYVHLGTLSIYEISLLFISDCLPTEVSFKVAFLFFIAVMSKSAQFGLHVWLPDAMEGPTPVSALIHAATMVTAGIFLMLKLSIVFLVNPQVSSFVVFIGSMTALFGATTGSAQSDIKKIIAFSTCSQLGYMVVACGLSEFSIAFFHLITHAFFKSLLFLCAGVVIHTLGGEQDIRKMGGLRDILPFTFTAMLIASWALSGVPFLSGYYSKDLIISVAFLQGTWAGWFSGFTLIVSALFTSLYSAKLLYYIFLTSSKTTRLGQTGYLSENGAGENFVFVLIPLSVLSFFSIFGGFWFKDMIVGLSLDTTLNMFSEYSTKPYTLARAEFLPMWIKLLMFVVSLYGYVFYFLGLAQVSWVKSFIEKNRTVKLIHAFFYHRWYFDLMISSIFSGIYVFLFFRALELFIQKVLLDRYTLIWTVENVSLFSKFKIESSRVSPRGYLELTFRSIVMVFFMVAIISPIIYLA